MKNVIFFQYPWRLWRERLAGIYRYAEHAGWHVQVLEYGRMTLPVAKALEFWRPDGCIVEGGYTELRDFRCEAFDSMPTVYCDPNPAHVKAPYDAVVHDSVITTTLAVNELFRIGSAQCGYVDYFLPREWSARRARVMAKMARHAGIPFHEFVIRSCRDMESVLWALRKWLVALPKPCGVLGANDQMAELVLQACARERIKTPEEIAVVGIDNDELLCMHAKPTLTSISPDFEQSGYLAAKLLDRRMKNAEAAAKVMRFGANHLVRRNSTTRFRHRASAIRAALDFIRENVASPISAADVCTRIGGSRSSAERLFREQTGHTIGEEILSARLSRAKGLLQKRKLPIAAIAAACGYQNDASLRRVFRRETGMSLREWRQRG